MGCSWPNDSSCSSGCWSSCGDGCGGGCSFSSTVNGGGSGGSNPCSGCTGDCTGNCSWCNSGNVNGWGSDDGGGGCTCGGNCSGSCNDTCEDTCSSACDVGCTSNEAVDLYNKLVAGLNKKILAADMTNINKMIQLEAQRRSTSTTSQSFSPRDKATSIKVKALQSNLSTIGFATSKDAGQKIKSFNATGQELIDKALDAYETEIKHS